MVLAAARAIPEKTVVLTFDDAVKSHRTIVGPLLKKLGFKAQTDGSFAWDGTKFNAAYQADPAAVRATLAKLGHLVETAASKELATDATVSDSMTSLNLRANALKAQQTSMLAVVPGRWGPVTRTT